MLVYDGRSSEGLAVEALSGRPAAGPWRGENLDRHVAMEHRVKCLQNDAGPSPADDAGHLVKANPAQHARLFRGSKEVERNALPRVGRGVRRFFRWTVGRDAAWRAVGRRSIAQESFGVAPPLRPPSQRLKLFSALATRVQMAYQGRLLLTFQTPSQVGRQTPAVAAHSRRLRHLRFP